MASRGTRCKSGESCNATSNQSDSIMASLYRPTVIRYTDSQGRQVPKGTPGAKRTREKSKTWRGKFIGGDGKPQTVTLSNDRKTAESMLADCVKRARREQAGDVDPFETSRKTPLADHVADFRQFLVAKANTPRHVLQTCSRIRAVADACHFKRLADLNAGRAAHWLAERRKGGLSVTSSNHHLVALKSFGNWLVRDRRWPENPFAHLSRLNAKVDVRIERRALSDDELARFISLAETSDETIRGLTGPQRGMLYRVATYTGFRAAELASLTEASFDLKPDSPTVTVEAACSKHRRKDVMPLHPALVAALRTWFQIQRSGSPSIRMVEHEKRAFLFPGTWHARAAEMLRHDLDRARIAWLSEADGSADELDRRKKSDFLKAESANGETVDFHALRHTFITRLAAGGVHPKLAQGLARHSSITLTMDRYAHTQLVDLQAALSAMPSLPVLAPRELIEATGTDDRPMPRTATGSVAPKVALRTVQLNQNQPLSTVVTLAKSELARKAQSPRFPVGNEGFGTQLTTVENEWDRGDSNPEPKDYESSALTD